MAQSKMRVKQHLFVKEYLIDKNATRAAKAAGYSSKTAYSIGQENLKKPEIKKAIEDGLKNQMERADISAERVINEIAGVAFGDQNKVLEKLRALELLGRYFGLFTNKLDVGFKAEQPVVLIKMPSNGRENPDYFVPKEIEPRSK